MDPSPLHDLRARQGEFAEDAQDLMILGNEFTECRRRIRDAIEVILADIMRPRHQLETAALVISLRKFI